MAKFPTIEEMAQTVAEKALDEYEYKGKTLREWVEIIAASELCTNLAEVGTDCISRQQAINDVESWVAVDGHERKLQRNVIEWLKNFPSATDNNVGTKIEPLTDKEQRIFLAAIERERKVCKEVDDLYTHEPYEVLLTKVCSEIERKVKKALWS